MKINPFDIVDSLLKDLVSERHRQIIHTLILLGAVSVTAILTYDGNWKEAIASLAAAAYAWSNRANTGQVSGNQDVLTDEDDEDVV